MRGRHAGPQLLLELAAEPGRACVLLIGEHVGFDALGRSARAQDEQASSPGVQRACVADLWGGAACQCAALVCRGMPALAVAAWNTGRRSVSKGSGKFERPCSR